MHHIENAHKNIHNIANTNVCIPIIYWERESYIHTKSRLLLLYFVFAAAVVIATLTAIAATHDGFHHRRHHNTTILHWFGYVSKYMHLCIRCISLCSVLCLHRSWRVHFMVDTVAMVCFGIYCVMWRHVCGCLLFILVEAFHFPSDKLKNSHLWVENSSY